MIEKCSSRSSNTPPPPSLFLFTKSQRERTRERTSHRTIKLNSDVLREFHDTSHRGNPVPFRQKRKERRRKKRKGKNCRKDPAFFSVGPPGTDKPATTRSISRKRDKGLYQSIRLPISARFRIQLPRVRGIYRETNARRCSFKRKNLMRRAGAARITRKSDGSSPNRLCVIKTSCIF